MREIGVNIVPLLPRLWRYALVLTKNRTQAEDLVQTVCARALDRAHQFDGSERLDRWLFVMMRRIWLNELRHQAVRRRHDEQAGAFVPLIADGVRQAEARLMLSRVLREVARLPLPQREALLLVHGEGYSHKEAAHMLGIPEGTLSSRIGRARAALKRRLAMPQDESAAHDDDSEETDRDRQADRPAGHAAVRGLWPDAG